MQYVQRCPHVMQSIQAAVTIAVQSELKKHEHLQKAETPFFTSIPR
jgi:hypothetical protein